MIRSRTVIFLFCFIPWVYLHCTAGDAACGSMTQGYPTKFSLSGIVELSYTDQWFAIPSSSDNIEHHMSFFEQHYGISAGGFIYHPRLAVFSAGIKFTDNKQLAYVGTGKTNYQTYGYDVLLTFLPYRPVSLAVFAGNDYYKVDAIGDFINPVWGNTTHDTNYTYYGARLTVSKYPFPLVRFEYRHDTRELFSFKYNAGTVDLDRYTFDMRGSRASWKTSYQLFAEFDDYASPSISYKSKEIRLNLHTALKQQGIYLHNSFNYSDTDFSKLLAFNSQLTIDRSKHHFNQYYSYLFLRSEYRFEGSVLNGIPGKETEQTVNSLTGSWTYSFFNGFISSLSLKYGLRDENGENAEFYGISFGLTYRRALLGFNVSPRYRILIRKDNLKGELLEHNVFFDLITKKLRFGTIYTNYSLTFSKEKYWYKHSVGDPEFDFNDDLETRTTKTDSTIQALRTGVRGSVPGQLFSRAQWNVEAEMFSSDTTVERARPESSFSDDDSFFESPTVTVKKEIRRYGILGNISYPIGWASIFFTTGYSIGKSNGAKLKTTFIENRIQYPISKKLHVFLRLKESWEENAEAARRRIDEYSLYAEYKIGRTTINATSRILRAHNKIDEIYFRTFFLRLGRTF